MTEPTPPSTPEPLSPPPRSVAGLPPPPEGTRPVGGPTDAVIPVTMPPRAGELTTGWLIITAATWIGVCAALIAVWNASTQLGLPTWWLGPRSSPQPRIVQVSPFIAPALMVVAAVNRIRRLAWLGLAASAVVVAFGVVEFGRVDSLAWVQLLIGVLAGAVSIASLAHTYRPDPGAHRPPPR
ncbi:MAG TPA: hypothetical protein VIS05_13215 [Ilumatobacter sp.]